ncbi:hypothetical protein Fmac_015528 [Flemingia macrophylla]|uniref:Pentatricopeptide repeat-containing protein n=1 Tax=Flemingia macrophylla TaxID=520843 RepID=A0ABD1MET9_9FABA
MPSAEHQQPVSGETKATLELLKRIEGHSIKHDEEAKMKKAKSVIAAMMKAGVKPNVVTFNMLMDGYFLINEVKQAKYVFHSMVQNGITPNVRSYSIMIDVLWSKRETRMGS